MASTEDDDFDWHEFHAWMKQRHRDHVARNMEDYQKYIFQMVKLGFTEQPMGAGHRFTHPNGTRIDFWRQSGKWCIVGTNKYQQGPKKMIQRAKELVNPPKITGQGANLIIVDELSDITPEVLKEYKKPTDTWPKSYLKHPTPQDDDLPPWEK